MKVVRVLVLVLAVIGFAVPVSATRHIGVAVSIKPVHSLVAAIMQGAGEPHLIVAGAGSPHTYSLKPSDARALEEAKLVFRVGPGLEAFLANPLKSLAAHATVISLIDAPGLVRLAARKGGLFEPDDDEDHGATDMHIWLDPQNAKAMADAISAALAKADPANGELYRRNARALKARLDDLEKTIYAELGPVRGRRFIVFHDAYQYFEKRFDVIASGSITISPDKRPGARRLGEIRRKIKKAGIVCVFAEPEFKPQIVSVAIAGTRARSGVLDPIGADLKAGPQLYFTLMKRMAASLKACLSGPGKAD